MSMTYDELKTAIQDYTENDETSFVNNLPLFIRLAEERILKSVQLNLFQKNQSGIMTTGNKYLAAPSDFLAPFSLSIAVSGSQEFLLFKDLDFVQTYTPDATTTGQPKYYAQFDVGNFILGPTPDANYTVDIHYLYRPASLTVGAGSGTTWLSDNAPDALLYGTLVEAATFLKVPEEVAQYEQRFVQAINSLKNLGQGYGSRDEYRYDIAKG